MPNEYYPISFIRDFSIPKDDATEDAFRLQNKLDAIPGSIPLKEPKTPFAVMLSGGWGSGKPSAMEWLDAKLNRCWAWRNEIWRKINVIGFAPKVD